MLALHETTRKRLCRLAFFALCLGPTLLTAAWIVRRHLPSSARAEARAWEAALHVRAELVGRRDPRPGVTRCERVRLIAPGEIAPFAEIQQFEWQRGRQASVLTAARVTVDSGQIDQFAARAGDWLATIGGAGGEFHIAELCVSSIAADAIGATASDDRLRPPAWSIRDVRGRVERDAAGTVRFALRAGGAKRPMTLAIEWAAPAPASSTTVALECAGSSIPPQIVSRFVPGFAALNPDAAFAGTVQWTIESGVVRGVARGALTNLSVAALWPSSSPHVFRGRADATIAELRWQESRVERIAGALRIADGEASESLIAAAAKQLYCPRPEAGAGQGATMAADGLHPIAKLACRFQFDPKGLTVWGDLDGNHYAPGCLAVSGAAPLLMQPAYVELPAGAWVQFVASPAGSWLPATRDAVRMAERLPLP